MSSADYDRLVNRLESVQRHYAEAEAEIARLTRELELAQAEVVQLRRALWLRHGCPVRVLYGDDGEMQCNNTMRHGYLDFRRDAVDRLAAALEE